MWEDVLVRGITPIVKEGKKVCLLIHGINAEGDKRNWSCFPNQMERDGETIYFFSGDLHLCLGAVVDKLKDKFDDYVKAIMEKDADAIQHTREELQKATRRAASTFASAQDDLDSDKIDDAKNTAKGVADKVREMLVGRVLRVHWNETQKYPGPSRNLLPIKRSALDGTGKFADQEISELLEAFEQDAPKSFMAKVDETYEALAEDEDYDANLSSGKSAKVASSVNEDDDGDVPF